MDPNVTSTAQDDVRAIYDALHASLFSIDTKALIQIMTHRTPEQMGSIVQWYKYQYNKDLIPKLESKVSGDVGYALASLAKDPFYYDCQLIKEAAHGMGTNDQILSEVLARRTNHDMERLKVTYYALYKTTLEHMIDSEFSGDAKKLYSALVHGNRDESGVFETFGDIEALYKAGQAKLGTDESVFFGVLTKRSDAHLRNVATQYEQKYGKSMESVIKSEFSGECKTVLVALVRSVMNYPRYVAHLLEKAMHGIGTNERMLTRVLVRHRGPLMEQVKEAYLQEYKKTLRKRLEGEVSKEYLSVCLALINEA